MTTPLPEERRRPAFGLPDRLLKAREIAHLEQSVLAKALDVSRTTISNYERGVSRPNKLQLREWAAVTAVDLDWLQNGETPRPVGGGSTVLVEPPIGIEPMTYSLLGVHSPRKKRPQSVRSGYGPAASAGKAA